MHYNKFLYILGLLLYKSFSYAQNKPLNDTALNRIIVEKVISSEYLKDGFIIIKQADNFDVTNFLEKNKPYFPFVFEYLQSDFNLGSKSIKEIVNDYQYHFDDWISEKFSKISIVKPPPEGITIDLLNKLRTDGQGKSIITILTVFYDTEKGKCLVYYHFFQGGGMVALLEKKKNIWQVVAHKAQSIE